MRSIGKITALTAVTIACLLALVDQVLGARQKQRFLVNLGASPGQLTRIGAALFAIPYATAGLVAVTIGFAICLRMVSNPGFPLPRQLLWSTSLALLAVGVLGTASVAALESRDAMREEEGLSGEVTGFRHGLG